MWVDDDTMENASPSKISPGSMQTSVHKESTTPQHSPPQLHMETVETTSTCLMKDDTMENVSPSKIALGSSQTMVHKESKAPQHSPPTAPNGDGRHGGDQLNLLDGH